MGVGQVIYLLPVMRLAYLRRLPAGAGQRLVMFSVVVRVCFHL